MENIMELQQIEEVKEYKSRHIFWQVFGLFCCIATGMTIAFLLYVWVTISEYENARPEIVVEKMISEWNAGVGYDVISYPQFKPSEFTSDEVVKQQYQDILQTAPLTYKFAKDDFVTGQKQYYIYADEEIIGKLSLAIQSSQQRLGFLQINHMKAVNMEPVLDILTWDYDICMLSDQKLLLNGIEVSDSYITGETKEIDQLKYLYEYVELPYEVTYHIDGLYEKPKIQIINKKDQQVEYVEDTNKVQAAFFDKVLPDIPDKLAQEIDVMNAAKTWSLFSTKDLPGPRYGLDTVRKFFIKDSYMWNKLGEYARGVDITFVSDHSNTRFDKEAISEFRAYSDECFSCRIHFLKHMRLRTGKEQLDETDSYFYFVRIDETDDGIDNPVWKIADIQAAVN